jgi:hypothetical protein
VNTEKVTRVEIINHAHKKGRVYSIQNERITVELSLQDGGRTLKVFIDERPGGLVTSNSQGTA